ncbi:AAC(3) family N-acetyltransferase [Saccharothrix xinjiangensis]|uniref:Aminoglycoside N(3)-acetyltransferase n=1 Tax=Saccharothrix xinjiangensis TaxID=204798 RepID=A0ABV9XV01_9PSEU
MAATRPEKPVDPAMEEETSMLPQHPVTRSRLASDLGELGLSTGTTVMVHTSLKSLGWVVGGEQTVLDALRDAVGPSGTLVMPAQSWQLCDPAFLGQAPAAWWPTIRDHLPVYAPQVTPTRTMGVVAELFRTVPGTLRSGHPHRSISANGPHAVAITATHDLDSPVGERSPLKALYDLDASVLLLGTTPAKITALHLAEHRARWPGKHLVSNGAALIRDGHRTWVTWEELHVEDDDFIEAVDAFTAGGGRRHTAPVGDAPAQLLPVRALVDFAAPWFSAHRTR